MKFFRLSIICLTLCALSSILTFCITNTFLTNNSSKPANNKTKTEDFYSSSITLSEVYQKCGHTVTDTTLGTITYSTTKELSKRFPGYEITSGNEEEIVMTAQINNFCPYHYKATLSGNKITIIRMADNVKITAFTSNPKSFSANEKSLLEKGISLDSQKALTSFIEDFTS